MENELQTIPQGGGSKVGMIVGIILAVLISAGATYAYYSQVKIPELNQKISNLEAQVKELPAAEETANETANWETYSSEKHSYSFKYPSGYQVLEKGDVGYVYLTYNNEVVAEFYNIENEGNTDNIINWYTDENQGYMKNTSTSQITVNETEATKIIGTFLGKIGYELKPNNKEGIVVVLTPPVNGPAFQMNSYDNGNSTLINNFNNILSTFQFSK